MGSPSSLTNSLSYRNNQVFRHEIPHSQNCEILSKPAKYLKTRKKRNLPSDIPTEVLEGG
ncbi:hypothetical protein SAMN06296036_12713 [Pseudobacteriovorax antillogorgiicola]|uniref:Uncharacterized protein n=1 Tax=Pseudobacteriovorax antillogorgiicola TaxID=1513793 RepID=A0A1Y6CLJ3_9BACT|nr:hypothetical protein EDD56_12714 [Pseudobacteriovorax antillogorgiicola]SMF72444.1 hypothetical protein SAMN06296036_12713 [Pseudobacteriovorax antillogorgiicola]